MTTPTRISASPPPPSSVAAAAGTDWASLSEQAIYRPLGMTATSSRFADFIKRDDRAAGHVRIGGAWVAKYQRDPDAQSPAGGVSSSARDMARWMTMVLQGGVFEGRTIVDRAALLPAVTAEIVTAPARNMTARPSLYGYGFNTGVEPSGRTAISHSGAFDLGAATNFIMIPSAGVGIVALSNAQPVGAVEALDASFADLVQFGRVTRDWLAAYQQVLGPMLDPVGSLHGKSPPANPAPAANLLSYEGTYANDYFGEARIAVRGDALALTIGPREMTFSLRHWDGNVFVYAPTGENAPDGSISKVTFAMDATGRASSMAIEFYADSGYGDFTRKDN